MLQRYKLTPLLKKILFGVMIFFCIYTIVGFFVLPPLLKPIFTKKLSEKLHREVSIKHVKVNPFILSMNVKGFIIRDREGPEPFISFDELYINLQSVSLFKKSLIVSEIWIKRPYMNIIRNEDESYNFSDLTKGGDRTKSVSESMPLRFSLNNIQIFNGSLDFFDGPKNTRHKIRDLTIKIPLLSNLPYFVDTYVQPVFEAKINDTPISFKGRTKPFSDSLETAFDINIKDFYIPYYLAYLPFKMDLKIMSGYIDTRTCLTFIRYRDKPPSITLTGDIAFKEINVVDKKGDPLINLPMLDISIVSSELVSKKIHLSKVIFQSPDVKLVRDKTGEMNIQSLVSDERKEKSVGEGKEIATDLVLSADEVRIEDGKFSFSDFHRDEGIRATLENIDLNFTATKLEKNELIIEEVSTQKGMVMVKRFKDEKLNVETSTSTVYEAGESYKQTDETETEQPWLITLKNIAVEQYTIKAEDLISNIKIINGYISSNGNLYLDYQKTQGFKATYKGETSFLKFTSVDQTYSDDLLKWDSLYLSGIDVGYNPTYLNINRVALSDFYSRLIINPDGILNVQGIIKKDSTRTENPALEQNQEKVTDNKESDSIKQIKVKEVTLQGGTINFTDKYIKPSYSANLVEIGGRISGLSSDGNAFADVYLIGKLEKFSSLEITGKINPLRGELYVALKIDFKDIDISSLTPYSSKYIGYTIQKGKLYLDLHYIIAKRKLDSQNNVFFDQLTLGDNVDSPDAIKLPVKFAIAVLKNRKNAIHFNLPVTGNIDDPGFNPGKIIIKMFINTLTKAATSPFALLGTIFGGGKELSYIEFDYGSTDITEQGKKKIDTLIKALYNRPALNLEIVGYVDIEKDKERLRQYLFNKKVKAQKLEEMVKKGSKAIPLDEVTVGPDEYPKYLKMAYLKEDFPKPGDIYGFTKALPVPEMEKLMLTHIEIKEDDLRLLASQRALMVKTYILESKQIEQEKIFLVEPQILEPEKKDNLKNSRVDFRLK